METVNLGNPDDIFQFLSDVSLKGSGVTTDNLMEYVLDEGFTEPTYLQAKGEDADAYYKGRPNAWAVYQIREWNRVLIISGGVGRERRAQITETP